MPSAAETELGLIGGREFGLDLETTTALVAEYTQTLVDEIKGYQDWLASDDFPHATARKRARESLQHDQEELGYFQSSTPLKIFGLLGAMYTEAQVHESEGLGETAVANLILDGHEEDFMPLARFIEHGIKTEWGYHFAQVLLAIKAGGRSQEE